MFSMCDNDSILEFPNYESEESIPCNPYRVPLKDALTTAHSLLRQLDDIGTRKPRYAESVEYVTTDMPHTRNGQEDTILYIVNYADNAGFAILGADSRLDPIYGISTDGRLDLSDTINNKGLAMCIRQIQTAASSKYCIGVLDTVSGNLGNWKPTEPIKPDFGERKITYYKRVLPKLGAYPSRWDQGTNFNKYCPYTYVSWPYQVGCGPLACTQIMSYYRWPTSFSGNTLDWDTILNWNYDDSTTPYTCPDILARFLRYAGDTLHAVYNDGGSGQTSVTQADITNNFHKFGYGYIGHPEELLHSTASVAIESTPILVIGEGAGNGGHCWVIDGYLHYKEEWDAIANPSHTLLYSMYHCVWGWSGKNNGYFTWTDNSVAGTTPFKYEDGDKEETSESLSKLRFYNLKFWSNFKPQK